MMKLYELTYDIKNLIDFHKNNIYFYNIHKYTKN